MLLKYLLTHHFGFTGTEYFLTEIVQDGEFFLQVCTVFSIKNLRIHQGKEILA